MNVLGYPDSPWFNPPIIEGPHDAIIHRLLFTVYGEHDEPMIRIIFRLPAVGVCFTTNIYFRWNGSGKSRQRLWHLFRSVGVELIDAEEQAHLVEGRSLQIVVR